jgi:hypothetical protein
MSLEMDDEVCNVHKDCLRGTVSVIAVGWMRWKMEHHLRMVVHVVCCVDCDFGRKVSYITEWLGDWV